MGARLPQGTVCRPEGGRRHREEQTHPKHRRPREPPAGRRSPSHLALKTRDLTSRVLNGQWDRTSAALGLSRFGSGRAGKAAGPGVLPLSKEAAQPQPRETERRSSSLRNARGGHKGEFLFILAPVPGDRSLGDASRNKGPPCSVSTPSPGQQRSADLCSLHPAPAPSLSPPSLLRTGCSPTPPAHGRATPTPSRHSAGARPHGLAAASGATTTPNPHSEGKLTPQTPPTDRRGGQREGSLSDGGPTHPPVKAAQRTIRKETCGRRLLQL